MSKQIKPELAWLLSVLEPYRAMPYRELLRLPEISQLTGPAEFSEFNFRLVRRSGERGGVEVSAEGWKVRDGMEIWGMCPSFEMLSTGRIVEDPSYDPRD
jgi:hypothetical protein